MAALIAAALLTLALPARAEYRAYRMTITNQSTGAQRTVMSNLDPDQYRSLYPVLKEETIQLENSWKCYGDTSLKPICAEPQPTAPPASEQKTPPKSDPQPPG